jgi:hypothetical protein
LLALAAAAEEALPEEDEEHDRDDGDHEAG